MGPSRNQQWGCSLQSHFFRTTLDEGPAANLKVDPNLSCPSPFSSSRQQLMCPVLDCLLNERITLQTLRLWRPELMTPPDDHLVVDCVPCSLSFIWALFRFVSAPRWTDGRVKCLPLLRTRTVDVPNPGDAGGTTGNNVALLTCLYARVTGVIDSLCGPTCLSEVRRTFCTNLILNICPYHLITTIQGETSHVMQFLQTALSQDMQIESTEIDSWHNLSKETARLCEKHPPFSAWYTYDKQISVQVSHNFYVQRINW